MNLLKHKNSQNYERGMRVFFSFFFPLRAVQEKEHNNDFVLTD